MKMNSMIPFRLCLCLLLSAGTSLAEEYNLRGTDTEGMTIEFEENSRVEKGRISFSFGGEKTTGDLLRSSDKSRHLVKLLEVTDGKVSKARVKVLEESSVQVVKIEGEVNSEKESGSLEGKTVFLSRAGGDWKAELRNETPSREQSWDLKALAAIASVENLFYPEQSVPVGHTWTIQGADLGALFGPGVKKVNGKVVMRLDRVEQINGEPVAMISSEVDIQSDFKDMDGNPMQTEIKGKGITHRSLKTYVDLKDDLTGTMKTSGKVKEGEVEIDMEITGELKATGTAVIKPIKHPGTSKKKSGKKSGGKKTESEGKKKEKVAPVEEVECL